MACGRHERREHRISVLLRHNPEYLERGVEVLPAQFPVSPSENWAHSEYGHKAGVSSFHWGTGSGIARIELEDRTLQNGVCDVPSGRCLGVNGLNLTGWHMTGDRAIAVQVNSPYHWPRKPNLVFYGAERNRHYTLSINGGEPVPLSGEQLEAGVAVPLPVSSPEGVNR